MPIRRADSVTEQALPIVPAIAEILVLSLLIAPRDAPRVTLGGMHVGSPPLKLALLGLLCRGALPRPAPRFALRGHRSSIVVGQNYRNYHVLTG